MEETLKVLMISSDRKLLEDGSVVSIRVKEYAEFVSELHIVLLCDKSHALNNRQLSDKVWVYPTNSSIKYLRPRGAAKLGKKIIFDRKFVRGESLITTQDPFECGWAGLKVKHKWRLPLEVQMHTDMFSPYFSGFLNNIRKKIARTVLAKADSIRVVSENLKLRIMNYKLNSNISVLPIYVDKNKIRNSKITFDLHGRYGWQSVILAVSRLTPEKNIALAIEVLSLVRQKFRDTGLVIVGSGSEEENLKAQVKSLKLENNVEFAGWQEDLSSFYKTADVFIQTSLFEGYGISLIEAGLYGLSIVTTPVGFAEDLGHGREAYIYPVNRPELFATGIIELIEDKQKRENLRVNMRNTVESRLISKEDYMAQIKVNWENTARLVDSN